MDDSSSDEEDFKDTEEIDFNDPNFILQNLSLATPTFESDKTLILSGRKDLANTIALQVLFYCYVAFHGFLIRIIPPPSILILGDGTDLKKLCFTIFTIHY